jgi:WD40 repeat protein
MHTRRFHRRDRHIWVLALLMVSMLILAGCGGNNPEVNDASPTPPNNPQEAAIAPTTDPNAVFLEPIEPITADNAQSLQALGVLEQPTGRASSIFTHDVSLDGTRLVALNNDLMLVWNLVTGDLLYSTERDNAIRVFYAPNQNEIYAVQNDGTLAVYSATQAERITSVVIHPDFNGDVTYQDERGWLAVGGADGTIKVWNIAERTSLVTLEAHDGIVLALTFDSSGERLASTGDDQLVKVWDWQNRTALYEFDHIDINAEQVAIAPAGNQVVSATASYVAVWDTESDDLLYSLAIERGGANDILAYSPDGQRIASGGGISDLLIWEADTGDVLAQLPEVSGNRLSGVFGADGRLLLTSVLDRAVSLWDLQRANEETVPRATLDIGTRRIVRADWTEDGFLMLFFDVDGVVYVWGIAEATP